MLIIYNWATYPRSFPCDILSNTRVAAPGTLAHRLQQLTARLIQNGREGLEIDKTLLDPPIKFH